MYVVVLYVFFFFSFFFFFFFNDTATTEIYTLSLHDALPIYLSECAMIEKADILIISHCLCECILDNQRTLLMDNPFGINS